MSKVFLLGANTSYDANKQAVEKNQIIQMNGYEDDRYVVYDVVSSRWRLSYKLINLRTKRFGQCDLIRPLSQKFSIGYYFDDKNPQIMDAFEVAILRSETDDIHDTVTGDFIIVDYSEKALAVFGDTRLIKDRLKAFGGRFNPKLTHEGTKKAGWIFSKSKRQELNDLLTVKQL